MSPRLVGQLCLLASLLGAGCASTTGGECPSEAAASWDDDESSLLAIKRDGHESGGVNESGGDNETEGEEEYEAADESGSAPVNPNRIVPKGWSGESTVSPAGVSCDCCCQHWLPLATRDVFTCNYKEVYKGTVYFHGIWPRCWLKKGGKENWCGKFNGRTGQHCGYEW